MVFNFVFAENIIKLREKKVKLIPRQSINTGCRRPAAAGCKGAAERIRALPVMKRSTNVYPVAPIRITDQKTMGQAWHLLGFEIAEYS